MRRYFLDNSGILQRSISFLLACLFLALALPIEPPAKAADPITTTRHYEWKQIKTQADIPAKGTYPMLLCYTDLNGQNWFLTGHTLKDDKHLFRDGVSGKQTDWPALVRYRYNVWLSENALIDSTVNKGLYLKSFPAEQKLITQYQDQPLESDYDTNYMQATDAGNYPEIALYSESFYTKSAPSDWTMTVTGETVGGLKTIQIQSGNLHLYDGYKVTWNFMAAIEWNSSKASSYSVYTTDVNSGRKNWTQDGCVQLFYAEGTLEYDTGLCWDYGSFGGIEDNNDHFSSFKLYYGVYKEFSVIDSDYVIPDGSILYADDNLELMPNVNLIVAPGGILSVNGVFFNNGVIHNCGTMILNPGAVVTTLEPEYENCGQINCYGAAHVDIAVTYSEHTALYSEWYGKSISELSEKLKSLEKQIAANTAKIAEQARKTDTAVDEKLMQETAELEELKEKLEKIFYERLEHPDEVVEDLRRNASGSSYSFSDCQGDIILLDDAALLFAKQPDSRLNLYEGSTCSSSGVIVAPQGVCVTGGELVNRSSGHLFIGYYFEQDMGNDEKPSVIGAGTAGASIAGLKADSSASRAVLDLSGKYHVQNDGTLLLNGLLCRTATAFQPGSRFFDKNARNNQKYYHW